jgi:hypothetical protein
MPFLRCRLLPLLGLLVPIGLYNINENGAGKIDSGAPARRQSGKDAKLAQKLGQLQRFLAVFPQECADHPVSFGPT